MSLPEPDYLPPGEGPSQPPFTITLTDADDHIDEYISMARGTWMGPYEGDEAMTLDEVINRIRGIVTEDGAGGTVGSP